MNETTATIYQLAKRHCADCATGGTPCKGEKWDCDCHEATREGRG